MTVGSGSQVAQGGTADTCRKYLARGGEMIYRLDLNTGLMFPDAVIPARRDASIFGKPHAKMKGSISQIRKCL